jgi:hypothetical protein
MFPITNNDNGAFIKYYRAESIFEILYKYITTFLPSYIFNKSCHLKYSFTILFTILFTIINMHLLKLFIKEKKLYKEQASS